MSAVASPRLSLGLLDPAWDPDVQLRSLVPGDSAALLEIFAGLSDRSRELRFLVPKPRLTAEELRRLTAVDHYDHVALLAVTSLDERPIGVARFIREREDTHSAEVAVAVVDAWQRRGVGTMLFTSLIHRARVVGIRRLALVMQYGNDAAVRLMYRVTDNVERLPVVRGTAEYLVTLTEPMSPLDGAIR